MTRRFFDLGDASVDLDVLVDSRLLVQANSGGGKSWCLRRLLEQTHGRVQHLVIDPEGEFSSLRERFDYVLAARSGGDTAADPRSAKLLAEKLLDLKVSAILDVYELKAHERVRFVRAFLEALVDAPKSLWHPALVVVDEAHVFCPQVGEAESAGAVIDLATRGRKRGFCAVLATQRLSKLHKDAAAECNNVLIGRTGLDVDLKRAADTLGLVGREETHALRGLSPGEFFAFGPAMTNGVTRVKIGPVATQHPKAGSRIAFTAPPPTAAVLALLPQLADLPAEADARAKTVEDLKRDNAELRRKLTLAEKAAPKAERVEVPIMAERDRDFLRGVESEIASLRATLAPNSALAETLARFTMKAEMPSARPCVPFRVEERGAFATTVPRPPLLAPRTAAERRAAARNASRNGDELTGPESRILGALAWMEAIGVPEPEETAAAFLAGYTIGGGAWNNPKGRLRGRGFIEYRGDRIALTDAGRALASAPDVPMTNAGLQGAVLARLPGPETKILRALLDRWPGGLSNDDLAAAASYAPDGGAYNNPRGRLRSLGLIEKRGDGQFAARVILFPEHA